MQADAIEKLVKDGATLYGATLSRATLDGAKNFNPSHVFPQIQGTKRKTEMTAEQLQKYRDMAHALLGISKHSIGLAIKELCNEIERQRIIIDGQDDAITSMVEAAKQRKSRKPASRR